LATEAIPGNLTEVTERWLGSQLDTALKVDAVSRIGADHGFASTIARVRGTTDSGPIDLAVKRTQADPAARELWFDTSCAPTAGLNVPEFRFGAVERRRDRGVVALDCLDDAEQGDVLEGSSGEPPGSRPPALPCYSPILGVMAEKPE